MVAYIDLSILVFLFVCITSSIYALILHDKIVCSGKEKINHFFFHLIAFIMQLFFIPYFYYFFFIVYFTFLLVKKKKLWQIEITYFVFYHLNLVIMYLFGGSFFYYGSLLINIPYACLFVFILPIFIAILTIIQKVFVQNLKRNQFIFRCKLCVNQHFYSLISFYDSGNNLTCNHLPVIFVKIPIDVSNLPYEIVKVNTIQEKNCFYKAYFATLYVKKKKIPCYFILSEDVQFIYQTNALLNIHMTI